ncbi:MAG: aspartate carbamoyltransferase [Thermoplasmatota archaeon]
MQHLLSWRDLEPQRLDALLAAADDFALGLEEGRSVRDRCKDAVVCMAFFEPSTRTRLSFEAAAHRLGARVIGFSDAQATSSAKGESLEDTARVLGGYADLLVLRHPEAGAAAHAGAVAGVPVVNAGDGHGEHPTQTLVDLFTLRRNFDDLSGLKVAFVGDLRYGRTVHSLLPLLQRLGARPYAVPAPGLELPDELGPVPHLEIEEAAADCDVLYVTRVQKERLPSGMAAAAPKVDRALLESTQSKAIVLHPLPRVDELATDVDGLAAAKYFDQAQGGVAVRMAVLAALLDKEPPRGSA